MPVDYLRGFRTDAGHISKWGAVSFTYTDGANASGSAAARGIAGAWVNEGDHEEVPGLVSFGQFHNPSFQLFPRRAPDGSLAPEYGRFIELRLSTYDLVLWNLLKAKANSGASSLLRIYHRLHGDSYYEAMARASYPPLGLALTSANGDHAFVNNEGLELILRLIVTDYSGSAGWS